MIYTFGHSNCGFSEFLKKLKENKINILVDVRTFPRSRFCPHFNKKSFEEKLVTENVQYLFRGKNLGGMGLNIKYEETIDEVFYLSKENNVCLMCSEKNYKECHRYSLLTPSFEKRGLLVKHIAYKKG